MEINNFFQRKDIFLISIYLFIYNLFLFVINKFCFMKAYNIKKAEIRIKEKKTCFQLVKLNFDFIYLTIQNKLFNY